MLSIKGAILKMARLMYPRGRAWYMPEPEQDGYVDEFSSSHYVSSDGDNFSYTTEDGRGGFLLKLQKAMAEGQADFYNNSIGLFDSIIADNSNFTIEDAHDWYRRLGIIIPSSPIPSSPAEPASCDTPRAARSLSSSPITSSNN